jgi:hypothetical protein
MIRISRKDFTREVIVDESPDLSSIGEYSNSAKSPAAIDRQERGDMGRNELRYFNPALTGEETGNPESPEQDYKRMEAYNAGEWHMCGVRASVVLSIPHGDSFITQKITSPGLWGIESDSGEDYFNEVFAEESDTLADMLRELGTIELVD